MLDANNIESIPVTFQPQLPQPWCNILQSDSETQNQTQEPPTVSQSQLREKLIPHS